MGQEVQVLLAGRVRWEHVAVFEVLSQPFSVEDGTLTRTMKPRKVIRREGPGGRGDGEGRSGTRRVAPGQGRGDRAEAKSVRDGLDSGVSACRAELSWRRGACFRPSVGGWG